MHKIIYLTVLLLSFSLSLYAANNQQQTFKSCVKACFALDDAGSDDFTAINACVKSHVNENENPTQQKSCKKCVDKCLGLGDDGGGGEAPPLSAVKSCEKQCGCQLPTQKEDVS